ncbi:MAG: acyl-CoA thioesterase [Burkholderiales bacterium]|nr:acyl-CoA thioesterase [Burkholderiales bacterium]
MKEAIYSQKVEFGDCDPARIVWFPNFFRWIDAASRHFFVECGVPPWHETERTLGIIGTPLVDTHAKFVKTASYGDVLQIHTSIAEWRGKSFVQRHRVMRANSEGAAGGADLIMECDEVRIFAARRDGEPTAIRALPVPEAIRKLCE